MGCRIKFGVFSLTVAGTTVCALGDLEYYNALKQKHEQVDKKTNVTRYVWSVTI